MTRPSERRAPSRGECEGLARRKPEQEKAAEPTSRPARPVAPNARRIALDVLDRVLGAEHRPFDETFLGHPQLERLAVRDRAFARLLVTTVLRRLGQIDHTTLPMLRFRPKELTVTNLLRLGAAQLLFLSTPPHAAVAETVRIAAGGFRREMPMLNAVLRRLAADGRARLEGQDAARLNTPRWLWESWLTAYGEERTRAIAAAHQIEPPLDISVRRDPEHWAEALGAEILPTGTLRRRSGGLVDALPGYDEGAWWVQDAAAALPALLLGKVQGRRVLDIGAAPGGKTAQLAAMGATVTAVERSPKRAEFLVRNLGRLSLDAEIVVADATEWRPREQFDAVLLDAPCTATGTIRRHPDVPWAKSPADVARLAEAQGKLLDAAVGRVAPGGRLVYAVCSLQPEEGPQRIAALLATDARIEPDPIRPEELRGLPVGLTEAGEVRTLPCDLAASGGLDGFFIARLRRRT
ncbi:MAG: RsmB/NOP family class I SAM-dependent RNA methyltransferase [Geminicoccaceae bacterium]